MAEDVKPKVQPGEIVQCNPDSDPKWAGVLCVVEHVRTWGLNAYFVKEDQLVAHLRLPWGSFTPTGARAPFRAETE